MSGKRKVISQREAVRNRRELRRLREFVGRIEGPFTSVDTSVCSLPDSAYTAQRLRDLSWGAQSHLAFIAYVNGTNVMIGAIRTPERTP